MVYSCPVWQGLPRQSEAKLRSSASFVGECHAITAVGNKSTRRGKIPSAV